MVRYVCKTAGLLCPRGGLKLALVLKQKNNESLRAGCMAVHTCGMLIVGP